jgi:WD40 repeat protein
VASGKLLHEVDPGAEEIYSVDWSPDGKLLASSGLATDICLWSPELTLLRRLPAEQWVISVKFSPNGSRLISAGGGATSNRPQSVTIWGVPPSLFQ